MSSTSVHTSPATSMPSRLAHETATLIARCESEEEVRETAVQALRLAAEHGFNHGNPEFVQALCEDIKELADAEVGPIRKQRLLTAVDTVCTLAAELNSGAAREDTSEG